MTWDHAPAMVGKFHARQRLAEAAEALAQNRTANPDLDAADAEYLEAFRETCLAIAGRLRAMDAPANGLEGTLRGVSGARR